MFFTHLSYADDSEHVGFQFGLLIEGELSGYFSARARKTILSLLCSALDTLFLFFASHSWVSPG